MSATSTSNTGSFARKLRKLRRAPGAFVLDSKLVKAARGLAGAGEPEAKPTPAKATGKPEAKIEPRLFASIAWKAGKLTVTSYGRKVAEPSLATAICVPHDTEFFVHRPVVGEFLHDSGFVGFRDRYFFVIEYDTKAWPAEANDAYSLVAAPSDLRKSPFSEIRNFVFIDQEGPLPAALRATHRNSRLVFVVTQPNLVLPDEMGDIDVLLAPAAFAPPASCTIHRTIEINTLPEAVAALKQVIVDHGDKEKSMFIPAHGEVPKVSNMSELLASRAEGLVFLEDTRVISGAQTFHDIVKALARGTKGILLREEQYIRYRNYCHSGDPTRLLEVSLAEGCRYEFLS